MSASPWGIELRGEVSCIVQLDIGQVRLNMSAQWDPVAAQDRYGGSIAQFFGRNETSRASLYWGESLLSNYRVRMQDQLWINNSNAAWNGTTKVQWSFHPEGPDPNITSIDFYTSAVRTIGVHGRVNDDGYGSYEVGVWPNGTEFRDRLSAVYHPMLTPLIETGDGLVKSFNSTIMTDLGQWDARPNILTDPQLLQHFTANFTAMLQTNRSYFEKGPLFQSYDEVQRNASISPGPLGVLNSTLASSYICNIPQQKPWPELLLAILVADLVFMRTLWSVFILCFGWWMAKDDVGSNVCEGCAQKLPSQSDNTRSSLDHAESDTRSQSSIALMPVAPEEI